MILFVGLFVFFMSVERVKTIYLRVRSHGVPSVGQRYHYTSNLRTKKPSDSLLTGPCGLPLQRCWKSPPQVESFLNSLVQIADWLESYPKSMELNVWTSSTVTSAEKDASGAWIVNVTRTFPDGTELKRVLRPAHVVLATGFGGGSRVVPRFPKQVSRIPESSSRARR